MYMKSTTIRVTREFKNMFNSFKREYCFKRNQTYSDEKIIRELIKHYETKSKSISLDIQVFLFTSILRKLQREDKNSFFEIKKRWDRIMQEMNVLSLSKIISFLKQQGVITEPQPDIYMLNEKYMY